VYGLARSILAISTTLTLALNPVDVLFQSAGGLMPPPLCGGVRDAGLFCAGPDPAGTLELRRWIAVGALLVAASGWRPRITGVIHWWVTFSYQASAILIEGGDQIAAVLTLLLLPVTVTDSRRWHWQSLTQTPAISGWNAAARLSAWSSFLAIRLQVAGIYLHAAVAKTAVTEWADGTAVYYWFTDPSFGAPSWLQPALTPLLANGMVVALFTWGAVAIEFFLFSALVMPHARWRVPFAVGLAFHAAIALVHGLVTFGLTMVAALVLYLRPVPQPFALHAPHGQAAPPAASSAWRAVLHT
jgi:antimicrobial peptide system SdpB family protein